MTERGGPTPQAGLLYQNSITALRLGRMLDTADRPDSQVVVRVRAEAWEHIDDTVVTFRDGHRDFIQAKEAVTHAAWRELWSDVAAQFAQSFARGTDRILLVFGESPHRVRNVREAAARAAGARTTAEWVERLTKDQADVVRDVAALTCIAEGSDDLRVLFASVDVEVLTLRDIEVDLVPRWMPPSTTTAIGLFRLLRDRVPGEATIRAEFDREALIRSLVDEDASFRLTMVSDADVASAAAATTALLRQHRATFGTTGHHLRRAVVDDILAWFGSPQTEGNVAMLIDDAGTGKSVVMRDVTERLAVDGFAVLAMKADLQLTGVATADEVRERLQLPDSVERIVERLARAVPVAVIVDQIDALSLTLAHDAATMLTVLDLIARLKQFAGVRVLISCRRFDRDNDLRLRRFEAAKEFRLILLTDDELTEALVAAGIQFNSLTASTRELLRIPLHLDLYLLTTTERNTQAATLQDLYASLLRSVAFRTGPGLPSLPLRTRALRELTAHMYERQRTTAAGTFFADAGGELLHAAAAWLASEGVLIDSDGWAFRHQTLFDYLFAREFVEAGRSLIDHLRESPQGLASRTALVQVLGYQRGTDRDRYLHQLNAIWNAPDIRFHLRHLLMRWFGMLRNPTQAETIWARRLLIDPAARRRFLRSAHGNSAWFAALRPELEALLRADDAAIDDVLWFFVSVMRDCQREVVSIVQPRLAENDAWRKRGHWMISWMREWTAPEAIDFFDEVMQSGAALPQHFFEFKDMARLDAERTANVILRLLDRQVGALPPDASPSGVIHSFNVISGDLDDALTIVAESAPETWLAGIVRLLERVFVFTDPAGGSGHSFRHDAIALWSDNFDNVERHVLRSALTALVTVGERDRDRFSGFIEALSRLEYITAQVLVARAYTHFRGRYSSDAVRFLLSDARRFWLGSGDAIHTRRLIDAIAHGVMEDEVRLLEEAIFRHVEWHRADPHDALRFSGIEHLYLLSAIPLDRLSHRARVRLDEFRRKFPDVNLSLDKSDFGFRMHHEHSPIEPAAAEQMRDEDWLRAMAKYNADDPLPRGLTSPRALAELLKEQTKKDPKRFVALSEKMPADAVDAYAAAVIEGLSESSAPPSFLLDAVRRFASQPGRRLRREISWVLQKHLRHIAPDVLDLFESWVRDPSLDDEHARTTIHYLDTDRGSALLTLGGALRTIDRIGTVDRRFALYDHIGAKETNALRAAVIEELVYELYDNHDRSIDTLARVIDGRAAVLLDAYHLPDLLHGAIWRTFGRVRDILFDLIASPEEKHQEGGARLIAVAAISPRALTGEELELARAVVDTLIERGQQPHKTAIARVLGRNVGDSEADYCFERLLPLMRDPDEKVRGAISQVFDEMTADQLISRFEWLQAYVASPALPRGLHEFGDYLIEHGGIDASRGLSLITAALDNAFDPDEHRWFDGRDFIQFVLRVDTDPRTTAM